jgi:hypothetical protein
VDHPGVTEWFLLGKTLYVDYYKQKTVSKMFEIVIFEDDIVYLQLHGRKPCSHAAYMVAMQQ